MSNKNTEAGVGNEVLASLKKGIAEIELSTDEKKAPLKQKLVDLDQKTRFIKTELKKNSDSNNTVSENANTLNLEKEMKILAVKKQALEEKAAELGIELKAYDEELKEILDKLRKKDEAKVAARKAKAVDIKGKIKNFFSGVSPENPKN